MMQSHWFFQTSFVNEASHISTRIWSESLVDHPPLPPQDERTITSAVDAPTRPRPTSRNRYIDHLVERGDVLDNMRVWGVVETTLLPRVKNRV